MKQITYTLILAVAGFGLGQLRATTVELVPVGNAGNGADAGNASQPNTYGAVSYDYAIGKYEVTIGQYTDFLNAVARTDTYNLYNTSMQTNFNVAGIYRTGSSGRYRYSTIGSDTRPVTYVSWFDAARFTNWLHNGQPNSGSQTAATTETGAYTLNGATNEVISKNGSALYWIPSENEWYKAAYHQPVGSGGDTDNYWLYPTRSNSPPNSRNGSTTDANSGNFFRDDSWVSPGSPKDFNRGYAVTNSTVWDVRYQQYLSDVGDFTLAGSYYGTFDQGGNVYEWNDAVVSLYRGLRGGYWNESHFLLRASRRGSLQPWIENYDVGFRVAGIHGLASNPELPTGVPKITVKAISQKIKEGKATLFIISAPVGSIRPVTVRFAIGGNAKNLSDYELSSKAQVTIRDGFHPVKITLQSKKDQVNEKTEKAKLTLLPGTGYELAEPRAATVSITDATR